METIIKLRPVRVSRASQLVVDVDGLVIYVNGTEYDFSPLDVGDMLPAEAIKDSPFVGEVRRNDNGLELELLLELGASAPESARFPKPIYFTGNGSVEIPEFEGVEQEEIIEVPSLEYLRELENENRLQPEADSDGRKAPSLEEILRYAHAESPEGVPSGE